MSQNCKIGKKLTKDGKGYKRGTYKPSDKTHIVAGESVKHTGFALTESEHSLLVSKFGTLAAAFRHIAETMPPVNTAREIALTHYYGTSIYPTHQKAVIAEYGSMVNGLVSLVNSIK